MNEPKNCPFCGNEVYPAISASLDDGNTICRNCGAKMPTKVWSNRPIEDALRARIAKLEQIADMLELTGDMLTMNPECSDIDKRERAWNKAVEDWNEYKRRQHDPSN